MGTQVVSSSSRPALPAQEIAAYRILFHPAGASVDGQLMKRFDDPRPAVATLETVDINTVLTETAGDKSSPQLDVISITDAGSWDQKLKTWLITPKADTGAEAVTVKTAAGQLRWRGGRAIIQGPIADREMLLAALTEFAFYEGELRRLESAILPFEATGPADISLAYEIHHGDHRQWDRLYRAIEDLYKLRMQYARLEPRLIGPSRSLPMPARRAMARLAARAYIEDRLEALTNRLETCEDLYEGAADRITDYRLYRKGQLLEMAIVVLLAAEAALLLWQSLPH